MKLSTPSIREFKPELFRQKQDSLQQCMAARHYGPVNLTLQKEVNLSSDKSILEQPTIL